MSLATERREDGRGTREGRFYLYGVCAAACPVFHETQTNHHKKSEFFNVFSQWQNHIAVFIRISSRSKIPLFGVVKIPLHKHTEQA